MIKSNKYICRSVYNDKTMFSDKSLFYILQFEFCNLIYNRMKWILFVFIVFSSGFLVSGQEGNDKQMIDQIVAVVGNNIVLKSEIETQYYQYLSQGISPGEGDMKCMILEDMLIQNLLLNQAELDSLEVTEKQVESELEHKMRYYINQIGSEEKLEEMFNKTIIEIKSELREMLRDQFLMSMMQDNIAKDIKISPSEVKAYFKKIPEDSLPFVNSEMEILQITKYPDITQQEIDVVKDKLLDFKERVTKGDKFSTLAVLYSEDPGSASKGGELGFVGRGDLVPEFAAVAFNLKPGEVSRVVETEYGYHIIQMIEKKGELMNCRHILLKPKTSPAEMQKAKVFLDSIADLIANDSVTFESAASLYSDDEDTKANGGIIVNPNTGSSKFEADQIDPRIYMVIKDLKVGEVSKPFEAEDKNRKKVFKIVCLRSKTQPHRVNLKDDYQMIQDIALSEKKQKTIDEWIIKRQKETYIRIDDSYGNCKFSFDGWIK